MAIRISATLALLVSSLLASASASAYDWTFKVGAHQVDPKSDNGTLAGGTLKADVSGDWRPTFQLEYFLNPNWGVEVLAATPFKHDVKLNGAKAAEVSHLPPTVSLQYHFNPGGKVSPFIGLGLNYTAFFDVKESGPLAGTQLTLGKSWGAAAHAGLDFTLSERWLMSVDLRWMDIDTEARVNGAKVGTVNIDPIAYGVAVGYRF
ncbi:MAG TPA: OmpW family outer membrane protein [Tahibacter sp.]|jgi:outer membrane protein|nr:OmpW family outer membrane protein [Tahibacter sp.]